MTASIGSRAVWALALALGGFHVTAATAQSSLVPSEAPPSVPRFDVGTLLSGLVTDANCGADATPPASALDATADSAPWKWKTRKLGKGDTSSIAVDPEGNPHVLFKNSNTPVQFVTHAWFDGHHWRSEILDADADHFGDLSLVIDADGVLHAAYEAEVLDQNLVLQPFLRYARKAADAWQIETVEAGGMSVSIDVDDAGVVHIVHLDAPNTANVRHLTRTALGWDTESIGPLAIQAGTALRLRSGKVYATFVGALDGLLHFALLDQGVWTVEDVDTGGFESMVIDPDGIPHVAYVTSGNGELRHAWRDEVLGWQHETLVSAADLFGVAPPAGLSLGADSPALAVDFAGRIQMVFQLSANVNGGTGLALFAASYADGTWTPTAAGPGKVGFRSSIAVAPSGIVHVSSGKSVGQNVKSVIELSLKGTKLSLSVLPKAAGTVTVSPTGAECTGKLATEFYPGTDVTLTEAPATGFTFVGWEQDGAGTDTTCIVTLDQKRKVVARFAPSP